MRDRQEARPPAPPKLVTLPLNEDGKKTLLTKLSADNYYNLMLHFLMPFDLLYTYFFRYGRVACNDMINLGRPDPITNDNGPMIDATQNDAVLGGFVTLSFIAIATLSCYWETNRQKKFKNMTSPKYIFDRLQAVMEEEKREAQANQIAVDGRFDIKDYINEAFENDAYLTGKYQDLQLNLADMTQANMSVLRNHQDVDAPAPFRLQWNPDRRMDEAEPVIDEHAGRPGLFTYVKDKFLTKILSPAYRTLILMSFVYWIEWIGTGIFTGNFFPFAVTGIPSEIAFGLPVMAGLAYPAIKIFNYFNNGPKPEHDVEPTTNERADTEKDISDLLRKALARREFAIQKDKLNKRLTDANNTLRARGHDITHANGNGHGKTNGADKDPKKPNGNHPNGDNAADSPMRRLIMRLRGGQWYKPAIMFASVALGSYVVVQYCTWIVTSLTYQLALKFVSLAAAEVAKTAILGAMGWPLIAISLSYGAYKAYQAYQTVITEQSKINDLQNDAEFDEIVHAEAELARYKNTLGEAYEPSATPHYLEEQFFKDINRHGPSEQTPFNKFLSRAFEFINGGCTGIFLARVFFVEGSAITLPFAAFALGYPVTLAVLGAIGIGFGAFKVYEYHLQRQDAHSNHLIDSKRERLEYLKSEVEFAKLQVEVLDAERVELSSRPEVPVVGAVINGVDAAVAVVENGQADRPASSFFSRCLPCLGNDDAQVMPVDGIEVQRSPQMQVA